MGQVKGYTRKSKSGKTVKVKSHTRGNGKSSFKTKDKKGGTIIHKVAPSSKLSKSEFSKYMKESDGGMISVKDWKKNKK